MSTEDAKRTRRPVFGRGRLRVRRGRHKYLVERAELAYLGEKIRTR